MIKLIPEITAEAERFRLERRGPFLTPRRDPVELWELATKDPR